VTAIHAQACAQSLLVQKYQDYPLQRVQLAATAYAKDFLILQRRLFQTYEPHFQFPSQLLQQVQLLSWELYLADASAQQIQYWFRTLLSPVPDCAPKRPSLVVVQVRIAQLVTLESDESSCAIYDGFLSSLVSDALSHSHDFLGALEKHNNNGDDPDAVNAVVPTPRRHLWNFQETALLLHPTKWCASSSCLLGLKDCHQPK
jgi:hypothetical protein